MTSAVFSNDVCRLCLWKTNSLLAIFGQSGDKQGVARKIRTLLPFRVSVDDPLPKGVCPNCVYKLEMFYEFYNGCVSSNDKLRRYLLGTVQPTNPPVFYVHDEADEDIMKLEILEDPIAVNCDDYQRNYNLCDPYDESGQDIDFDNSAHFQEGLISQDVSLRDHSSACQDGSSSGKENSSCLIQEKRSPHGPSKKTGCENQKILNTIAIAQKHSIIEEEQTVPSVSTKETNPIEVQSSPCTLVKESNLPPLEDGNCQDEVINRDSPSDNDATVTSSSARIEPNASSSQGKTVIPTMGPISCVRCSQKFKTRALLNLHFCNSSTPSREKRLCCRYCDRTFKFMHHLTMHKKVHTSKRLTFSCKECGKKFESLKAMRYHRISDCHTVKAITLDHMYSSSFGAFSDSAIHCDMCKRSCATRAVYGKHLKSKEHRYNLYKISHRKYLAERKLLKNKSKCFSIKDKNVNKEENVSLIKNQVATVEKKVNVEENVPMNLVNSGGNDLVYENDYCKDHDVETVNHKVEDEIIDSEET